MAKCFKHSLGMRIRKAILLHADGQSLFYWQDAYRQIAHNKPNQ